MEKNVMDFARRFIQLRNEADLTQEELAKKLGISKGAIGNYESGIRTPRAEDLDNIADYFNVSLDYLLGRNEERPEITLEEQWIINCYRNADSNIKEAIKALLKPFGETK